MARPKKKPVVEEEETEDENEESRDTFEAAGVSVFDLPAIFAEGDDGGVKAPLTAPIVQVAIRKKLADGTWSKIDELHIDQLADGDMTLLRKFGPGTYQCIGLDQLRQIRRRRTFTVGNEQQQPGVQPGLPPVYVPPPSAPIPANGIAALITAIGGFVAPLIQAAATRHDAMMAQVQAAQADARQANAQMLQTITSIFAARVADVENQKPRGGGGETMTTEKMTDLIALGAELATQNAGNQETAFEKTLSSLAEGFMLAQKTKNGIPAGPPPSSEEGE